MKLTKSVSKLLTNKYVLYVVAALAFFNVFGYLVMGSLNAVIFFILIGYLVTFFSNNMIIILGTPLILVNLFMSGKALKEGFDANADSKSDEKKKDSNSVSTTANATGTATATATANKGTPLATMATPMEAQPEPLPTDENFKNRKSSQGGKSGRIDYGSTIESAYDDLNKILGGDSINKLTTDTQTLIAHQAQLAKSMEQFGPMMANMAPMLEKAQGLLGSMGGADGLQKMMGGADLKETMAKLSAMQK